MKRHRIQLTWKGVVLMEGDVWDLFVDILRPLRPFGTADLVVEITDGETLYRYNGPERQK